MSAPYYFTIILFSCIRLVPHVFGYQLSLLALLLRFWIVLASPFFRFLSDLTIEWYAFERFAGRSVFLQKTWKINILSINCVYGVEWHICSTTSIDFQSVKENDRRVNFTCFVLKYHHFVFHLPNSSTTCFLTFSSHIPLLSVEYFLKYWQTVFGSIIYRRQIDWMAFFMINFDR